MTLAAGALTCRGCREPLVSAANFCVRCGLPTGDACPRCGKDLPLAVGECPSCAVPLVHCETCGRTYGVERTRCRNVDWNCLDAPLVSAFGACPGLHGSLARTSAARGGPCAMQPLGEPQWTLADSASPLLEVLAAYGRAFVFTPRAVLSLPLRASGAIDPFDSRVLRSSPLAARGREFRAVIDAAVGFGQVCLVAERHDRRAEVLVFRADDVSASWRLEGGDGARTAVPVPEGVLLFTDTEVKRYAAGSVAPDAVAVTAIPPRGEAPPAVADDGAFVVYGGTDGSVWRIRVETLETLRLLGPGSVGPPVLGPHFVHALSRESGAAVTLLHQIEVDTAAHDAVSLPLKTDLRLRGAGAMRLVFDIDGRAYRAVTVEPWPGRLQADIMPRPVNEDIIADLLLEGSSKDLLLAARDGGRGAVRLVRFDGETVLRGALDPSARFIACDDRIIVWSEGRLECHALA